MTATRVEGLGKCYQVMPGQEKGMYGYRSLRESLADMVRSPFRRSERAKRTDFWALKDVSFKVEPGEVVGVIGHNGAGKSTLLKILSRITKPTKGRVHLRGRVGSLLEVGTGFHPELTGRENIYLNGSILGMSRKEINRRFDEIVAFGEVEKFLDTPVKRYSSGMYVRLAFAVAANLEPEILLVDEVLSVGDQEFQKKCLGKMNSVTRSGRTVFFVSHQLAAVEALCSRVLVIERGSLVMDGDPHEGVGFYLARLRQAAKACTLAERTDRGGTGGARFTSLRFYNGDGHPTTQLDCGGKMVVEVDVNCEHPIPNLQCALIVSTGRGQRLFRLFTGDGLQNPPPYVGQGTYRCVVEALNLMPGPYSMQLRLFDAGKDIVDDIEMAAEFTVVARDVNETGRIPGTRLDLVFMPCTWSFAQT